MAELVAYIVAGLATGAIYALAAIGFTLVWQTSQTINFAQGEYVMLPAILILAGVSFFGLPIWAAALLGAAVFVVVFGLGFKIAVVDPMIRHGVLPLAIATMALATIMKEGAKDFFSSEAQTFPSPFPAGAVDILGVSLSLQHIAIIAVAFVAIGALQWFVTGTRTAGRCRRPPRTPASR